MQCAWHPGVEAHLQCRNCSRLHCEPCVRKVKAGREYVDACAQPHCHGLLRVASVSVPRPKEELVDLVRRVFSFEGVATAIGCAVPRWISNLIGGSWLFSAVYVAAVASFYFITIDHVGRGRSGLPGPSDGLDDWWDILGWILRALVCILIGFAPVIVWTFASAHNVDDPIGEGAKLFGLLLIGLLYVPAVILAVVITEKTIAAFWPPIWIEIAMRAPLPYLRLVGIFFASIVLWSVSRLFIEPTLGSIPILGSAVIIPAANLLLFLQAAFFGAFLRRHAEEFGYA